MRAGHTRGSFPALLAVVMLSGASGAWAAVPAPTLALLPTGPSAPQAATVAVDVVEVNRSAAGIIFPLGDQVAATLSVGAQSWPVTLRAETVARTHRRVPPGGFRVRRYELALPAEARGRAILQIAVPAMGVLRAVIDITSAAASKAVAGSTPPPRGQPRLNVFQSQRTFNGRLAVNEPVYFILGPKRPGAKFQFSFEYRLLDFGKERGPDAPNELQLAFTQRSLWDVSAASSPFYDTSYEPELRYQWLATSTAPPSGLSWLGLQSGLRHESNGRDGVESRSLDVLYVQPLFSIGSPDGWHAVVAPEFYDYVGGLGDNHDLIRYRGYDQLRLVLGRTAGVSLMLTLIPGENFEHGSRQLDLSIPIGQRSIDFGTFVLVQYFDGYGESLLSYSSHTSQLRAGIQFVR